MRYLILALLLVRLPALAQDDRALCREVLSALSGLEPQVQQLDRLATGKRALTAADAKSATAQWEKLKPLYAAQKARLQKAPSERGKLAAQLVADQEKWAMNSADVPRMESKLDEGADPDRTAASTTQSRQAARQAREAYQQHKAQLESLLR